MPLTLADYAADYDTPLAPAADFAAIISPLLFHYAIAITPLMPLILRQMPLLICHYFHYFH